MAVALVSSAVVDAGGSTTAGAGSDRAFVIVGSNRTSDVSTNITPTVSALSFGTPSLANGQIISAVEAAVGNGSNLRAGIWFIKEANIPAGSQTLSITWSHTMQSTTKFAVYTLSGVDQTSPIDTTITKAQASATAWQQAITVIEDSLNISAAVWGGGGVSATPDSGWTEVLDGTNGGSVRAHSQYRAITTAGAYTWGLTLSLASGGRIAIASFAPVPAAGGGNAPRAAYMSMMG